MHTGHGADTYCVLILNITSTSHISSFICENGTMLFTQALKGEGERRCLNYPWSGPSSLWKQLPTSFSLKMFKHLKGRRAFNKVIIYNVLYINIKQMANRSLSCGSDLAETCRSLGAHEIYTTVFFFFLNSFLNSLFFFSELKRSALRHNLTNQP